jgi:hypothetical protein
MSLTVRSLYNGDHCGYDRSSVRGSRRARGGVVGAVLVAACVAVPSVGASPRPPKPPRFTAYSLAGSLTITWRSNPAGCAAAGLCGIRGALVEEPAEGDLSQGMSASSGRSTLSVDFFGSGTVRVRRDVAGSAPTACVDVPFTGVGIGLRSGRTTGRFAKVHVSNVNGRCAGPLSSDLPVFALPVRRTSGSSPSYDLRGTEQYTAGPFTGKVISTLVLRAVRDGSGSGLSFGSFFQASRKRAGGPHRQLSEVVFLEYRVDPVSAPLVIGFRGEEGTFCRALDSCGAHGQLVLTVPDRRSRLDVVATRRVSSRRTSHQALADFRAHPGSFRLFGYGPLSAAVHETFNWPDGPTCSESTVTPPHAPLELVTTPINSAPLSDGRRLRLAVTSELDVSDWDALRTGCPGPATVDVTGQRGILAVGSLDLGRRLRRLQTLELQRPGAFAGPGYIGHRGGSLRLKLSLIRVKGVTGASG